METLPTRRQAFIAAATARVLSTYSDDEVYLCLLYTSDAADE